MRTEDLDRGDKWQEDKGKWAKDKKVNDKSSGGSPSNKRPAHELLMSEADSNVADLTEQDERWEMGITNTSNKSKDQYYDYDINQ